ncbi:spore cortex biosynthesis protein YabQ [Alicyclobacillus shizuokensis]|uniref:spore cortex biosynthesis protein YabQ n=1 Tax=Alicyclobacillus shizuokensis TaxID=392014 RepID=UPI0008366B9D|nr:spore cortex biosynthesis protein YabQ [Alicyclobacillus shizuokensis]MCL6626617.1 spore cortex biosynthesis protein YabQ [Alicyclobacillus shizuokensis]
MNPVSYMEWLLVCGGLMGAVFDIYNTVLASSRWLRWLRPVLDLAFWLVAAAVVFYVTFVTDFGRFRVYTFALLLIGWLVYRVTLHHTVVSSAFAIMRMVRAVALFFAKMVDWLLLRPLRFLLLTVWVVLTRLYWLLCQVENGLFWVVRFWLSILAWPLRGPWQHSAALRGQIRARWEGIWERASNWILRDHHSERL